MRNKWVWLFWVFTGVSTGCSSSRRHILRDEKVLHTQASNDFSCAPRDLLVLPSGPLEHREYLVQGCGKRAMYRETELGLVLASPIEEEAPPPPRQ